MNPENRVEGGDEKEQARQELLALAREFQETKEALPFPGINKAAYERIKAADEEYPGFTTPVDEILERLQKEGMKIIPKDAHPNNYTFFVLPAESNNIEMDSLPLHVLQSAEALPDNVSKLILAIKKYQGL